MHVSEQRIEGFKYVPVQIKVVGRRRKRRKQSLVGREYENFDF